MSKSHARESRGADRKVIKSSLENLRVSLGRAFHSYRNSAKKSQKEAGELVNPPFDPRWISGLENGGCSPHISKKQLRDYAAKIKVEDDIAELYETIWGVKI